MYVILDHGHRVRSAYCHGSALHVEPGATVETGALVMESGNTGRSTGPHLHFGLRIAGRPIDPTPFRTVAAQSPATAPPDPAPAAGETDSVSPTVPAERDPEG